MAGSLWVDGENVTAAKMKTRVDDRLVALEAAVPGAQPLIRLLKANGQTINNSSFTPITWDSQNADKFAAWSASDPTKYFAPKSGWYQCSGTVMWVANSAGRRLHQWRLNGQPAAGSGLTSGGPGYSLITTAYSAASVLIGCNQGDYIQLCAFQDSGGDLGLSSSTATAGQCSMFITWVASL